MRILRKDRLSASDAEAPAVSAKWATKALALSLPPKPETTEEPRRFPFLFFSLSEAAGSSAGRGAKAARSPAPYSVVKKKIPIKTKTTGAKPSNAKSKKSGREATPFPSQAPTPGPHDTNAETKAAQRGNRNPLRQARSIQKHRPDCFTVAGGAKPRAGPSTGASQTKRMTNKFLNGKVG